jgi:hypothetical protein
MMEFKFMMLMLSTLTVTSISTKEAQKIMSQISNAYRHSVPYELTIITQDENGRSKPGDTINIKSNRSNFYMSNGSTEEIMTKGIYLTVDHSEKSISIEKMDSNATEWKTTFIDDFIKQLDGLKLDTCLLFVPAPDSTILIMSYHATNLYVNYSDSSKKIYRYEVESFNPRNIRDRSLNRVIYDRQVFNRQYTEKDFPLNDFISIGKDSIRINKNYTGYFFKN